MPILHWLTREEDLLSSGRAPYRLLEHMETYGDANTENMLIQGDNLEGLKALLPYYAGKVKCIYIDPPYNTRSAFDHYDDNLEHTQWLSMMYPRLELLRDLLSENGSIWVTLDNNESHYMKIILDEIFGRSNFIVDIAWRSADSSNNDSKQFSLDHNSIFVYSKKSDWQPNKLERTEDNNQHYSNPDNDPNGPWFAGNLSSPAPRKNLTFNVISPQGNVIHPPKNGWRWSKDRIDEMIDSGEIIFVKNGTKLLRKTYLRNQKGLSPASIWDNIDETGHNRQAKYEQKKLFPQLNTSDQFRTPKPERLIQKILHIATAHGDYVLDSFLGSGTTAAVAHKIGRRYIGIEIGDHAVTHCIPRLQKVIDGEQGGISKAVDWNGGGGFRFYRLGQPIFDEDGQVNPGIKFPQLAAHIWFSETKTPWKKPKKYSPLLGVHEDVAYYLLYNGILGDKRVLGGNVLTSRILDSLSPHPGPKVVYGERCLFGPSRLAELDLVFKHTPYEIKGR